MVLRIRRLFVLFFTAACVPSFLTANPMISVDTVEFKVDTIVQGQVPVLKRMFKITNTGTAVLLIKSVRPG